MRLARRFLQPNVAPRIPFGKLGDQRRDSRPDGDDLLAVRAASFGIAERRLAVFQLDGPSDVASSAGRMLSPAGSATASTVAIVP